MLDESAGEQALGLFVEHLPAAVAVLDPAFRYVLVSRRWAEDFGLAGEDLAGAAHFDFFEDPEDAWQDLCRRCLDEAAPQCREMWLARRDGPRFWVRWELHPWYRRAGEVAGLMAVAHDRTERRRLDAERIRQANDLAIFTERLKQLHRLSTSTYGGLEDLLDDYLRTGREIFGMEVGLISRVEGERCVFQVASPEAVPGFEASRSYPLTEMYCQTVVEQRRTVSYADAGALEALQNHPAHVTLKVQAYLGTPVLAHGALYGVLLFVSRRPRTPFDAQDHETLELMAESIGRFIELDQVENAGRQARQDLVTESEFLQAVLDNIQEGIVACDERGILTLFNRATRRFHGLPERPLPPEQWAEHYSLYNADGTPMETAQVPLFRALQGEQVRDVEMQIMPREGRPRTIVASGQPLLDAEGRRLGAVVAMHDISDRKRTEEALRLEKALVQLLQEVAVAAHEASTVEQALQFAVDTVCAYTGWPVGHVYLPVGEAEAVELVSTDIWHLDDPERFATFREVTEATRFTPGLGLPGRVLDSGKPAWIIDVLQDASFSRAQTARDIKVRAGFAFPVLAGRSVAAVLEFFAAEAVEPDEALLEVMEHIGAQLGLVVERMQAARRLLENERKLERAQEIAHLGYWEWNVQSGLLYWSDELYRIYGLEPGEGVSYEKYVSLLHPEDRARVEGIVAEALRTHASFDFYHRIIRPDGQERILHGEGEVVSAADGAVLRMFGTGHDVTGARRAEEILRESEERYRLLAENASDMIVRASPEGVFSYVSPACRTLLGFAPEELVGHSGYDFIHPDDFAHIQQVHEDALEASDVVTAQYRLRMKNGDYVWVETTGRSILDPDTGQVAEIISVTRDISARRAAEERLRLLEASVSASLDGITISDVKEPDNPLVYVSPGFERMTGYPVEEVLGRNCRFLQRDDREQSAIAQMRQAIKAGRQCRVVLRNYRKDGSLFWNELTLYPLHDRAGSLTHYVGIQRDISERKQAEQELARINAQLEQRNRELQDFAYVASHDLQEPLRKIRAFADLMREDYDDAVDENGRYYLERMQDAAARMSRLITDLLAYSRVTTKARPFDRVDLNEVAADVLSDLEVQISEVDGRVEVGPLPAIDADPTQMRQLLQNFIANALKFHRPGVRPVVALQASLEDDADGEEARAVCRLVIRDNGIGFDEKYLDRIFTPFQRLHSRSTYAGTGMGLAICRRIAERHQGRITARSRPGEGTTFIVTLPVHQPNHQAEDEPA